MIPDQVEIEVDIRTLPGQSGGRRAQAARRRARRPRRRTSRSRRSTRTSRPRRRPTRRCGTRWAACRSGWSRARRWCRSSRSAPPTPGSSGAPGSVAYGFGLFSQRLVVRRLRLDVPRQRRARRHRVPRALDPALGRPRPTTSLGLTSTLDAVYVVALLAEVALEVFGERFARREVVLVEPVLVVVRRRRRRSRPSVAVGGLVVAALRAARRTSSRRRRRRRPRRPSAPTRSRRCRGR